MNLTDPILTQYVTQLDVLYFRSLEKALGVWKRFPVRAVLFFPGAHVKQGIRQGALQWRDRQPCTRACDAGCLCKIEHGLSGMDRLASLLWCWNSFWATNLRRARRKDIFIDCMFLSFPSAFTLNRTQNQRGMAYSRGATLAPCGHIDFAEPVMLGLSCKVEKKGC